MVRRWKGYFDQLLNEENPRSFFIPRIKKGKATGMDGILVDLWKCLGEYGICMFCDLMQRI